MVDLFRNQRWDLVSKRGWYYLLSGTMLLVGLIFLIVNSVQTGHALNLGIDFTGGSVVTYRLVGKIPSAQIATIIGDTRSEVEKGGVTGAEVQVSPGDVQSGDQLIVRVPKKDFGSDPHQIVVNTINPAVHSVLAKQQLTLHEGLFLPALDTLPDADKVASELQDKLKSDGLTDPTVSAEAPTADGKRHAGVLVNEADVIANKADVVDKVKNDAAVVFRNHQANLDTAKTEPFPQPENEDSVSGSISATLLGNGLAAIILGSFLIMLWIWLRYNVGGFGLRYSIAGILALMHDLGTLIGMFAILHLWLQVNSPFIAALLTVLGYSIHDTIVIFDRIRENLRLRKGRTFAETINISLLETMARSVNTILTVLFTLLALLFFGGSTLRDFVAAMLIGVIVGGYSSIFIASQLLVSWTKGKEREILPPGETLAGLVKSAAAAQAAAGQAAAPTLPVAAQAGKPNLPAPGGTQRPATTDAIQKARQAGKTARRRR